VTTPPITPELEALVARLVDARVEARLQQSGVPATNRASLLVFSGDMDRLFAALTVALASAASGMEVSMYFTFWGLTALRKRKTFAGKSLGEKVVAMMLPSGPASAGTSQWHLGGIGPRFFKHLMQRRNVETLPNMLALAQEMGVRMIACEMSMDVMGITRDELLDGLVYGGAATYVADAAGAKITLFV
jgi:peroxiredoxin family protein